LPNGTPFERGMHLFVTDDRGELRAFGLPPGQYLLQTERNPARLMPAADSADTRAWRYAATWYPGTTRFDEAQPVTVESGQDVRLELTLTPERLRQIRGRVIGTDGQPVTADVVLAASESLRLLEPRSIQTTQSDGVFLFPDVEPGKYLLETGGNEGY